MRLPSQVVRDLRGVSLSDELLFSIRMSADKTVRSALDKATDTLEKALNLRKAMAELIGEERPSEKDIDAAARKKAHVNAKRRAVRKKY
jgi:hypothetical protein